MPGDRGRVLERPDGLAGGLQGEQLIEVRSPLGLPYQPLAEGFPAAAISSSRKLAAFCASS
jgi:hypothetical protein